MFKKIAALVIVFALCFTFCAWAQYGSAQEQYFEGSAECAEVHASQGILILRGQQGQKITIYVSPQTSITNKMTGGSGTINNISPGDMVGVAGLANSQTMSIKAQKIIFLPQFKSSGSGTTSPSTSSAPSNTCPQSAPQTTQQTYPQQQQSYPQGGYSQPNSPQLQYINGIVSNVSPNGIQLQTQTGTITVTLSNMTRISNIAQPVGQMASATELKNGDMVTVAGQQAGNNMQGMMIIFLHQGQQPHSSWNQTYGTSPGLQPVTTPTEKPADKCTK